MRDYRERVGNIGNIGNIYIIKILNPILSTVNTYRECIVSTSDIAYCTNGLCLIPCATFRSHFEQILKRHWSS